MSSRESSEDELNGTKLTKVEEKVRAEASVALQKSMAQSTDSAANDEDSTEDERRYLQEWGGLLHPDTPQRFAYDTLQFCIMIYLGWALPVRLVRTQPDKNGFHCDALLG